MNKRNLEYNKKLLPLAKVLRSNNTLSEVILWNHIKDKNLLGVKFRRQVPIANYIVDFFSHEIMLAIEIDGNSHDLKIDKDADRQKKLERMGVRFFRINDVDVKQNIDGVLEGLVCFVEALKK